MRELLPLLATGLLMTSGGCSTEASPDDFSQAEVSGFAAKCGVPNNRIKLHAGHVVVMNPAPDDEAGACLMRELRSTGKKNLSVIGNELHTGNEGK